MSNWIVWFSWYYAAGIVVCGSIMAIHKLWPNPISKSNREWLDAINKTFGRKFHVLDDLILPVFAFIFISLIWPFMLGLKIKDTFFKNTKLIPIRSKEDKKPFSLIEDELKAKCTVEQIEESNLIDDPMDAVPQVPFGHLYPKWVELKESLQPGEVLWRFETKRTEVKDCESMWGYAVKRDSQIDRFWVVGWRVNRTRVNG